MSPKESALPPRGTTRLAALIEVLCRPRPDLCHDDGTPNASAIARAGLRRGHSLSQPTISRILHGQIQYPSTPVVVGLADIFGVSEAEIRGETQDDADLTPLQRSIAERWSKLPAPVQDFIATQIDQILEFQDKAPAASKAMFKGLPKSRK